MLFTCSIALSTKTNANVTIGTGPNFIWDLGCCHGNSNCWKKIPFCASFWHYIAKWWLWRNMQPKRGKKISFWRCKTCFLSHLLFVKHRVCAQIVMSYIFCRFRYIFISQTATVILNVISPKCNNQHNKELRDIYPISYAKYQFLVYYTADVDLLLLTILPMWVEAYLKYKTCLCYLYISTI